MAVAAVLAGGMSARVDAQDWKAARVWAIGGDAHVWVVAASSAKGTALSNMQFWYSPISGDGPIQPRQRPFLPPVMGNPLAVAADAVGLRVLFSDLTVCDYFPKRSFTPGASWQEQCRIAPLAWCGDATEPVLWALVETQALTPPPATEGDEAEETKPPPVEEIHEHWTVLRLQEGVWRRVAGPSAADGGRRFWMASRAGDLNLFWAHEKEVQVASLHEGQWGPVEVVLKGESVRHAWTGVNADGPMFIACKSRDSGAGPVEVYQRRNNAWSMVGQLREGNEFLSVDPQTASLAVAAEQVVVARRTPKGQVEFGTCDPEGERPVRFEELSLYREPPTAPSEWQDAVVLGLVLGVMTLVLWMRRSQVAAPISLPVGLVPAAVWRRVLATALDFAPAVILLMPWWFSVMPDAALHGNLQSISRQADDPELQAKLAPVEYTTVLVYGLWCMIWEMLIGTSPGKYMFGCKVLSVLGTRARPRQILVRNLVRVLMVSMGASGMIVTLMMIVMVTRNRQRVGDLLAGTIVVEPGLPPEDTETKERSEDDRDDPPT